jgi:hypothetical protein
MSTTEPYERLVEVFADPPVRVYDHTPPGNIQEANLVSGLVGRLRDGDGDVWARREVDPWDLIEVLHGRIRPDEAGERYEHPLQPDVDVLYCETDGAGERTSPLVAVEAKHFAQQTGDGNVMPKLAGTNAGFYAGLGQALSLLLMGVEYVFLVHFVYFHPDLWADYGDDRSELVAAHRRVTNRYAESIATLVEGLDLPVGYVAAGTRPAADAIAAYPVKVVEPAPNPFADSESGRRVRGLFAESFNAV